jgi:LPXTG-motif cell wall-anchored protein
MKAADIAKLSEANTLDGQPVAITTKDDKTQINDATVTKPDQETTNGVIQTIDRVLVPPELSNVVAFVPPTPTSKDLVDAAQSTGNFNTLSSLLKTAGLVDTLKGQGPFTLFAPTDNAFAQLSPQTLDALSKNPQKLAELLKYHVVQGSVNAADVAQLTGTKTLEGNPLAVTVNNGKTQINDATMTGSEMQTANGVIHPIDRVLVPPALRSQVVALAPSTPKPGATPAAGKGTAIAQVQGTAAANATAKPAAGGQATAVPTRVPPQAATATAAASKGVTSTHPISGTAGTGGTGLPTTGASDNMFVLLLAAVGLVGVLVVARRLRTSN